MYFGYSNVKLLVKNLILRKNGSKSVLEKDLV